MIEPWMVFAAWSTSTVVVMAYVVMWVQDRQPKPGYASIAEDRPDLARAVRNLWRMANYSDLPAWELTVEAVRRYHLVPPGLVPLMLRKSTTCDRNLANALDLYGSELKNAANPS